MSLDLYFCLHSGEESFTEQLRKLFFAADIVVLEQAVRTDSLDLAEEGCNALSRGEITLSQILARDGELIGTDELFFRRLNELIHRSQKRICFERSPLSREDIEQMSAWNPRNRNRLSKHFLRDYLRDYEKRLSFKAACHRTRDEKFAIQLADLQRNNKEAHILAIRGTVHKRGLEGFLSKAGVRFKSHLWDSRVSLVIESDIVSRMIVGGHPSEHELLMAAVQLFEIKERAVDVNKAKLADLAITYGIVTEMSESELQGRLLRLLGSPSPVRPFWHEIVRS